MGKSRGWWTERGEFARLKLIHKTIYGKCLVCHQREVEPRTGFDPPARFSLDRLAISSGRNWCAGRSRFYSFCFFTTENIAGISKLWDSKWHFGRCIEDRVYCRIVGVKNEIHLPNSLNTSDSPTATRQCPFTGEYVRVCVFELLSSEAPKPFSLKRSRANGFCKLWHSKAPERRLTAEQFFWLALTK